MSPSAQRRNLALKFRQLAHAVGTADYEVLPLQAREVNDISSFLLSTAQRLERLDEARRAVA